MGEELTLEQGVQSLANVKSLAKDALVAIHEHDVPKVIYDVECLANCSQQEGHAEEGVVLSSLATRSYLAHDDGAEQKLEEEVMEIYLHPDRVVDFARADPDERYDLDMGRIYQKAS